VSHARRNQVRVSDAHVIEYVECGHGQPLVYFHGAGGVFAKARFLGDLGRTFRVLAPSRPGYDGSTGTSETARDEAAVMAAFIRVMAGGPAHLVAESAGAACALWVSILQPDLVNSLVLAAPTAFVRHAPPHGAPPDPRGMEAILFGTAPAWTEPLDEQDAVLRQRNAAANAARIRPANANQDLLERLPEVGVPTLILWGTADRLAAPESGQIYSQRIPASQRLYIYGGAHSLPVAACDQFVRLTAEFIERGDAFIVNPTSA
jgi:pimeloyl-ACP methyl ester carboxylesterase